LLVQRSRRLWVDVRTAIAHARIPEKAPAILAALKNMAWRYWARWRGYQRVM
jgi:hypothetical protein